MRGEAGLPRRVTPIASGGRDPVSQVNDPSQVNGSSRQGRHQDIHDKMGMQRIRSPGEGERGRTAVGAVDREGEVTSGNGCVPGA